MPAHIVTEKEGGPVGVRERMRLYNYIHATIPFVILTSSDTGL